MAYTITYHPAPAPNGTHNQPNPQQTEWITPEGWSAEKARTTFEAHFGVTVVSCEPIED